MNYKGMCYVHGNDRVPHEKQEDCTGWLRCETQDLRLVSSAGTTFEWRGHVLECLDADYNTTALNERAVEVPIANAWHYEHELMDPEYLEVGNVLSHYGWGGHRVVDLYEEAEGVVNIDVMEEQGGYDRIVAISTLEHVGTERGVDMEGRSMQAIEHLRGLLLPGGEMLITVPFGQAPFLDVAIMQGRFDPMVQSTMLLDREGGGWYEEEGAVWRPARENGWAQAVWVATWSL